MRVVVVVPPAPVVTWGDADTHLKLDGDTTQQAYVEGLIAGVTAQLDGPTGWLGRAIGPQTLEARLDNFDCGSLRLPYPPLIEILSVTYVDPAGVVQTVPDDLYEVRAGALMPVFGRTWPAPRWQRDAVIVRYRAGYDGEPGRLLPAQIKPAILLMVGDLYKSRESFVAGVASAVPMPASAENLLAPLRIW